MISIHPNVFVPPPPTMLIRPSSALHDKIVHYSFCQPVDIYPVIFLSVLIFTLQNAKGELFESSLFAIGIIALVYNTQRGCRYAHVFSPNRWIHQG